MAPQLIEIGNMTPAEVRQAYDSFRKMEMEKKQQLAETPPGTLRHRWRSRQYKNHRRDAESFLAKQGAAPMDKLARIFGAQEPDVSEAAIPYGVRKRQYSRYAKAKAKEKATPMGKASLVGGLVGGGIGALGAALSGPSRRAAPNAVIGGVLGGLGGALVGAGLSAQDESHIRAAKSIVRNNNYDRATLGAVRRQLDTKQHQRELNEFYKEQRAEDRHHELRNRLDRIDRHSRY